MTYRIADRVVVHLIAELNMGLNLVAFGDGHVAHVVAKAGNLEVAAVVNGGGDPHPVANLLSGLLILPVTHHHGAGSRRRAPMKPNSRPPWAVWFRFMKSMSISLQGRSRLNWVWNCSRGFCS